MMVYLFQFIVMHLDNINMQGEREINIKLDRKLWIYNVEAFINLKLMKHLSNSLISMSTTIKHWAFIYAMDAKKTSLNTN